MEQISIENVLIRLNDTVDYESLEVKKYGIRFITSEGEIREITCKKRTKQPKAAITKHDPRGNQFYSLQGKGVIMLDDLDAGMIITVKPAMIYGFKDCQSTKWLNVYH